MADNNQQALEERLIGKKDINKTKEKATSMQTWIDVWNREPFGGNRDHVGSSGMLQNVY